MPLFQSLSEKQLDKLANAVGHTTFADGEIIIKQGDDGDMFYVIESGLVRRGVVVVVVVWLWLTG